MKDPQRIYKRMIRTLFDAHFMTQRELADSLGASAAAVSRALGRLEGEGLVRRVSDRENGRAADRFCIGDAPMLVMIRPLKRDAGFEYITMNFDGSEARCENMLFRPELSFDDNCKVAISEVAMKIKLIRTGGRAVAIGVVDDEARLELWRRNGVDIAVSESGFAYALGEMRGGVCCFFEVISVDDVRLSIMIDGKVVCHPRLKKAQDIEAAAELAAALDIERVFLFAPENMDALAEEKLRTCFGALDRPLDMVNCSTPYQEELMVELLADVLIDLLI
jgi:DNA-binding Lrp family transcriptional regulator